jgi:hypothetical protein
LCCFFYTARLQTVSACESLHHDHNNNPYWMVHLCDLSDSCRAIILS